MHIINVCQIHKLLVSTALSEVSMMPPLRGGPSLRNLHCLYPANTSSPANSTPTRAPITSTVADACASADAARLAVLPTSLAHANSSLPSAQSTKPSQCSCARMHCLLRHCHSLAGRHTLGGSVGPLTSKPPLSSPLPGASVGASVARRVTVVGGSVVSRGLHTPPVTQAGSFVISGVHRGNAIGVHSSPKHRPILHVPPG